MKTLRNKKSVYVPHHRFLYGDLDSPVELTNAHPSRYQRFSHRVYGTTNPVPGEICSDDFESTVLAALKNSENKCEASNWCLSCTIISLIKLSITRICILTLKYSCKAHRSRNPCSISICFIIFWFLKDTKMLYKKSYVLDSYSIDTWCIYKLKIIKIQINFVRIDKLVVIKKILSLILFCMPHLSTSFLIISIDVIIRKIKVIWTIQIILNWRVKFYFSSNFTLQV